MAAGRSHGPDDRTKTRLKVGDTVMVIAGGNNKKPNRTLKSQVGKLKKILFKKDRIIVEGLNIGTRHKRALSPNEPSGKIQKEGSIHISNVMYYHEGSKQPVRLTVRTLEDGRKVRGFIDRKTKKFEQIDA
jgi:large subunit ribosomal protein L24